MREFLKAYLKTRGEIEKDEKCVIVSHSSFLGSLSARGYDKEKKDLVGPEHMHNC